jgi:hypothetical protein
MATPNSNVRKSKFEGIGLQYLNKIKDKTMKPQEIEYSLCFSGVDQCVDNIRVNEKSTLMVSNLSQRANKTNLISGGKRML